MDFLVGEVDGRVVLPLDDLAVETLRGELDLEADDIAFPQVLAGGEEVLGPGHVHLLPGHVADPVTIGVEPDGGVEGCLSPCPSHPDMAVRLGVAVAALLKYPLSDLALPVPAPLAGGDIGTRRPESLVRGDMVAEAVGEDVGRSVLEADVGAVGFGLGAAVVEEGREGRVGDAMGVLVVLFVGNSVMSVLATSSRGDFGLRGENALIGGLQKLHRLAVEVLNHMVTYEDGTSWWFKVCRLWQGEFVS